MKKNPTQKSLKIKSFFSRNPITVFVSPYNYFSITPIAIIKKIPTKLFLQGLYTPNIFKPKQITISYDMTRFGRNPLWASRSFRG
jgi:hypothetical protein